MAAISGETKGRPSGWTVDTLKEYVDTLRSADKDAVAAALVAVKKETEVAEQTNKEWRKQSNEWRGAMDDRDRKAAVALEKYATRDAVETQRVNFQTQLDDLKTAPLRRADVTRPLLIASSGVVVALLIAVISLLALLNK